MIRILCFVSTSKALEVDNNVMFLANRTLLLLSRKFPRTFSEKSENIKLLSTSQALEVDKNVAPFILKKLAINIDIFNSVLDNSLASFSKVTGGNITLSNTSNSTLISAANFAKEMKDEYVSIEHLILAIFKSKGFSTAKGSRCV